jgi:hypothetical protein
MNGQPPYAADPLNPTDEELSAAIQRGLADGTLIDAGEWLERHEADAMREHLRTADVHARYIAGYELDRMTAAELTELHDDMPVTVTACRDYPGNYR